MKLFKTDLSKAFEMLIFTIVSLFFSLSSLCSFQGALRGSRSLRVQPSRHYLTRRSQKMPHSSKNHCSKPILKTFFKQLLCVRFYICNTPKFFTHAPIFFNLLISTPPSPLWARRALSILGIKNKKWFARCTNRKRISIFSWFYLV